MRHGKIFLRAKNHGFLHTSHTSPYNRSDTCRNALTKFPHLVQPGYVCPLRGHTTAAGIPEYVNSRARFGFFIGAYLAEGCLTEHQIHISNNDPEYRAAAAEWPTLMGIKHHVTAANHRDKNGGTSISIMFHSSLMARIIRLLCNHGAAHKKIPACALTAPDAFPRHVGCIYIWRWNGCSKRVYYRIVAFRNAH